jgi:hypothetical protein
MRDTKRNWRRHLATFCLLSALPMLATATFGQTITTADVAGQITDSTGAVVPGAKVAIKSLETGENRSETASGQGQYRFTLLKPGDYEISAASQGLKSNTQKVTLLVGQAAEVNIAMTPQGTSTTVEVQATAAVLATENANLETNFNRSQVADLPMPGGDLTTLAMTAPGIRVNVTGGSSNMNANGIPGASILYTNDGMDQNDPANNINNSGASNNLLGANAVGEVAVVMNAYSPQYGRMAGANVNMVGISGTNQFHGNLFYNFNWEQLNANSFFANAAGTPRGRSDAHQFGGRIGGPVKKNKLFFFFDHENLRYVLPGAGVVSLPSPQLQTYALAHVGAAELPLYQDYFKLVNASPGINRAVAVTNGPGVLQDGNGHLGCGINNFYKTPTGTGGTFGIDTPCAVAFGTNNTQLNTEMNYTPRVDWNITDKQKLFFKYNRDQGVQATGTSPVNPLYNSVSIQPANQFNLTDSWVITPTAVNSITASALWYSAQFGLQNFQAATQAMPEQINITDGGANGGGFANVGGGTYPYGLPVGRNVGHFQINDDFSWIHGTHTFKAGVNARYDQYSYSSIAQNSIVGTYSLGDLADFANGKLDFANPTPPTPGAGSLSSFSQSYPLYGALHFRYPSADFYASDEWAVTKNLKLTYGLRFEKDFNPTCNENCFVLTNVPFTSSGYQGGVTVPYNATLKTNHDLFYNAEGVIVQPRVGLAYKPFASGKTVIRTGIGYFSTNYTDGLGGTLANQVPNKFAPGGLTFGSVGVGTDANSSAYVAQLSANAFQTGFNNGYTLTQIQNAVKPATFGTPSIASFPSTFRAPKSLQWSFEIEQQLTSHNVFTVSYVGNHGSDLQESVNANMYANPSSSVLKTAAFYANYGGLPSAPADARFVTVTQYYNNGISNYEGLTFMLRHAFSYGLTAEIHYTWSHALGTIAYENPFNLNNSYGSLGFDNRHQAAGDLLWNQPFKSGNGVVNALIKGWTVGAKLYVYSGAPFSVSDSKIASSANSTGVLTPLADLLVPNATGADCGRGGALGQSCLPKTDFASYVGANFTSPLQMDWGNIAPNSFRGPGYFDLDTTVERTFAIKERFKFTFGIQAYNVLNHANFANPSGTLTSGSFGTITNTLGPPTSIYGTGQGASVSGRLAVLTGRFVF